MWGMGGVGMGWGWARAPWEDGGTVQCNPKYLNLVHLNV